ncbi:alpha/beta fold hydrolase [Pseudochryseolinea flava]|uniref:Alpha/beta hydrolase n=1 Tax=Pseudochryseolinea flava TaxID=2059302 RepID=A0A364YA39_9BACT|nr:alpha/beta hydrolase [Pseudochryseolinea flava]RAW03042.1 alpha/beta hydrolase [Pseudochryseolinea flava]
MTKIFADVKGNGHPVILLHGFPMSHLIWKDFSAELAKDFQVITPDLPGFGQSDLPGHQVSLSGVADAIVNWIQAEKIINPVIIGHSLGGYVALAMVKKYPDFFSGLGLFHSTALADTPERKESRTKVLDFVERNGAESFNTNFIEPLFATNNNPAISDVKEIAKQTSARTVIAYTLAMRDRKNEEETLAKFPKPIFFLGGEKDQGISPDSLKLQAAKAQHSEVHILSDCAHMAMYEQTTKALTIVREFVYRCHQ